MFFFLGKLFFNGFLPLKVVSFWGNLVSSLDEKQWRALECELFCFHNKMRMDSFFSMAFLKKIGVFFCFLGGSFFLMAFFCLFVCFLGGRVCLGTKFQTCCSKGVAKQKILVL